MLTLVALLKPTFAYAQEDEVITDPELDGPRSNAASSGGASGDEVIADPELGGKAQPKRPEDYGWGDVYKPGGKESTESTTPTPPPRSEEDEPDPMANTGIGKLELIGQTAIDVHSEGSLEDFYEARLRLGGEVDFRLSRKLRLSLGTRIDFAWYAPYQHDPSLKHRTIYAPEQPAGTEPEKHDVSALDQDRYELDIVPLAAYIDGTPAEGLHIRFGTQVVSLGRMDGFSVVDMLAVLDFRPQASADPGRIKMAQPAVRMDWDMSSWATLQLVYIPWFMPHVVRANRDTYVGSVVTSFPKLPAGSSQADINRGPVNASLDEVVEPSWQTISQETNLRFLGPAPDFSHPQAEARVNFRGSGFELALLGGTALEKLPAIYYTPTLNAALVGVGTEPGDNALSKVSELALAGYQLFDVEYHRYYLVGFDGSFDISPIQIGFEFGYSPSRHLYAVGMNGSTLPLPDVAPRITDPMPAVDTTPGKASNVGSSSIRKGAQVIQAALHAEYLKGEELAIVAEMYLYQVFSRPHDTTRQWLGFGPGQGTYVAGLIGASYALAEGKYRFDLSCLTMMGPSMMLTPQFEAEVAEGFYLNIGAQIYEGPPPNNIDKKTGDPIPNKVATNLTPGGVLSGYDNIYLGFRWVP